MRQNFLCVDCGICTHTINEYYMVRSYLWKTAMQANPKISERKRKRELDLSTMLCLGCLEKRLKRELTPDDFTDCPLNKSDSRPRSIRYQKRLGIWEKESD